MAQLRLKNFSDFDFIQQVDKPKVLAGLLAPHEAFFSRQGIDIMAIQNCDEDDRRLFEVFTSGSEDLPDDLLDTLYVIDHVADEAGHDKILEEAERQDADLSGIVGSDMSPGDFAITVYLQHPTVVRAAQERTVYGKIKQFEEYPSAGSQALTLAGARQKRVALEERLGPAFEKMNRSRACDVYVYEEGREIKFQITHGKLYRTDAAFNKKLRRARVAYRPQKHDSVFYDTQTEVLKISAQTIKERDLYRRSIGEVVFGDPEYFPVGDIYTLAPLAKRDAALKLISEFVEARLTEVWIQHGDEQGLVQISKARNLLAAIKDRGLPDLSKGQIIRAAIVVRREGSSRLRKIEIRLPNVAIYDRTREEDLTERFLAANRLLRSAKE